MRAKWSAAARIAQINVVLLLCQGTLVRLVYGWEEGVKLGTSRPPLVQYLFFMLIAAVALVAVIVCAGQVELLPRRWQRIVAAIGTIVFQFIMFQVFIAWLNR
jgi:hypothetical protein